MIIASPWGQSLQPSSASTPSAFSMMHAQLAPSASQSSTNTIQSLANEICALRAQNRTESEVLDTLRRRHPNITEDEVVQALTMSTIDCPVQPNPFAPDSSPSPNLPIPGVSTDTPAPFVTDVSDVSVMPLVPVEKKSPVLAIGLGLGLVALLGAAFYFGSRK